MFTENYVVARRVLRVLSFIGFFTVAIGMALAILTLININYAEPEAFPFSIGTIIVGFCTVAGAQVSFALLDQADASRASLAILKEVALAQGVTDVEIAAAIKSTKEPATSRAGADSSVTLSAFRFIRDRLGSRSEDPHPRA